MSSSPSDSPLDRPWDPGLQPERTALAWRRYALLSLGLGLALPRIAWNSVGPWSLLTCGVVVVLALMLLGLSGRRYRRVHRGLISSDDLPLPDGRMPTIAALIQVMIAITALLAVTANR